jgi:hypothetical protein
MKELQQIGGDVQMVNPVNNIIGNIEDRSVYKCVKCKKRFTAAHFQGYARATGSRIKCCGEVAQYLGPIGDEESKNYSVIKYFSKDPNGLNRGAGAYYLRGHGYYSKYSRTRDYKKLSKNWKVDRVGLPKSTRIPQISDGRLWR